MLSSNNKIVSSRFFEQTNFEQLIITHAFVSSNNYQELSIKYQVLSIKYHVL
jgi:hypothetical protein